MSQDLPFAWEQLPSLPIAEGVAGPFVGTHKDVLLLAGGANFPDKMPWEGGKKAWYDSVFVLESIDGPWKEVGKLARPLGYGVSISTVDGVVCIGGSDADAHYADCFRMEWNNGKLRTTEFPALPKPCANFCGALVGRKIYVAGGLERPTANTTLKTFWSLDLADSNARWQEHDPWPGQARMLAVAAVEGSTFFICSGTDLSAGADAKPVREYLRDAYSFETGRGWKKIAEMPRAAVAAPTPALSTTKSRFLIMSGDDGSLVSFRPIENHPGFPRTILAYDTLSDEWRMIGAVPKGQVTTGAIPWKDRFVIPSGEVRPGKRTAEVWSFGR